MPRRRLPITLTVLLAAACSSAPRPQTALEYLAFARAALDKGDPDRARFLLESVDEDSFRGEDLARYRVLLAEARIALEEYFDAFKALEEFTRKFPTSEYRSRAADLQYEAGQRLAASGWSFLGLFSDLSNARVVLEHFLTAHPRSRHIPDVLRILGEAAYRTDDWELAIERFKQLAQRGPGGAWSDFATFRIAMAHYKLLEGPDYDAAGLERARQELAAFLSSDTTNETFLAEARAALAQTLLWTEEKNLRIARYYVTIGEPHGARLYVQRVLDQPDARLRERARSLLSEIEALERAKGAPNGTGNGS